MLSSHLSELMYAASLERMPCVSEERGRCQKSSTALRWTGVGSWCRTLSVATGEKRENSSDGGWAIKKKKEQLK